MSLESGSRLGPYEIVSHIESGGMGAVYRAMDRRLDRQVAIKVLTERLTTDRDAMLRFEREAKALAALSHTNILTIYDVGTSDGVCFVVMELLEGESLRARLSGRSLPWRKAFDLAASIADGLSAAHSRGVIHRDLKPENIFLTSSGNVKVVDFGLAKIMQNVEAAGVTSAPTEEALTRSGYVMGTINYMAPEQARGDSVDARSDIFAFGCMLYEMVTGSRPFSGNRPADVVASILKDEPTAPSQIVADIPAEVDRIIMRCLEKQPEKRFQNASDLAFAVRSCLGSTTIRQVSTSSDSHKWRRRMAHTPLMFAVILIAILAAYQYVRPFLFRNKIDSIAVLPFENMTKDPETEYLSDGITEGLINSLAALPKMKVVSRSTVFRYKGVSTDPQNVGKQLHVGAVLSGRITKRNDQMIHMSLDLTDTKENRQIWGEQYDRPMPELLSLQQEISRQVSSKLLRKVSDSDYQQLAHHDPKDSAAYELYLKGRFLWRRSNIEGAKKAIQYFDQAIELEPSYALAYVGLADSYNMFGVKYWLPPNEIFPKAKSAAETALRLDRSLAEAHIALGVYKVFYEWDWQGAMQEAQLAREMDSRFKTSIEMNTETTNHYYCALLDVLGRPLQSVQEHKRALSIDPMAFFFYSEMAWSYYIARDYDTSIAQARKGLEMDSNSALSYTATANSYREKRMFPEAIKEMEKAVTVAGNDPLTLAELAYIYGASGEKEKAEKILRGLLERSHQELIDPVSIALIYVGLGKKDDAFEWLEKGYVSHSPGMVWLRVEPKFDPIRSDPRFQDLLQRVKLS